MSSRKIVGNYRSSRARGASVRTPVRNRQNWFASLGKFVLVLFGLSMTVLAGVGLKEAFIKVNAQKISTVKIEGSLTFVSRSELEEIVNQFVATSLVALELDELKQELEKSPWVKKTEIRRQWPDRLNIKVEEEVAIARWGDGSLLNQQGQIFKPGKIAEQLLLPHLSGPESSESKVMVQYQQMNQLLYPLGVRIRNLELNDRGAWTITFANPAQADTQVSVQVKIGKDEVLARLRRLVTFLGSEQAASLPLVETIDLRYANGLAVAYRDASLLPESSIETIVAR